MNRLFYFLPCLFLSVCFVTPTWGEEFEWTSVSIRGGVNFNDAGLPPGEKEDFEQFDVVGTLGFPGAWEAPWGWSARYQMTTSGGALRGNGNAGFIGTMTVGAAVTKIPWRTTLDFGLGGALLSKWKFGRQNVEALFNLLPMVDGSFIFLGIFWLDTVFIICLMEPSMGIIEA